MRHLLILFSLLIAFSSGFAQSVPVHLTQTDLYDFMDELANDGYILLNSAVKPYSKKQIFDWLEEANNQEGLTERQKKQIDFYLKEYRFASIQTTNPYGASNLNLIKKWTDKSAVQLNQLGYFYKDDKFSFAIKPIWGVDYRSNDSGSVRHFWGGLGAWATVGSHWSIYASLRDNSITEITAFPNYFTQEEGGNYKIGEGGRPGGDYSEMRGGVTYAWSWGDVGLIKDHVQVGDNY
ncbi:MAG: hypothetical protein JXR34_07990, partial [Bacteroidales bacterium]|nr:hypothetical protein [Bacteroidales bacterium]